MLFTQSRIRLGQTCVPAKWISSSQKRNAMLLERYLRRGLQHLVRERATGEANSPAATRRRNSTRCTPAKYSL